jgi:hypothetical protein
MAYDATVQGNWGCLPEHYPAVVDLVLSGKVALEPFLERRPMAEIESVFADLHARRITRGWSCCRRPDMELKSHDLLDPRGFTGVLYEEVPVKDGDGRAVPAPARRCGSPWTIPGS